MKKLISLTLLLTLLLIVFSGCSTKNNPPKSPAPGISDMETPNAENTVSEKKIILFLPDENANGFITKEAMTDGTAEHIVSLLIAEKALSEDCALLSFVADGNGGATVDMNTEFMLDAGRGSAAYAMVTGSLVNTLLTFYNLDTITITIEGTTPEVDHGCYGHPLKLFYN